MSRRFSRRQVRFGGPAIFTPRSIPGLVAWYRADLGVTIATGVSGWADQSGTGDANKNLAQATGSAQPTRNASDAAYNNQSTLSFASASSQCMTSGTWASALAQPFTWFVVGNDDGAAVSQVYIEGDTSGVNRSLMYQNGAAYELFAGASLAGGSRTNSPRVLGGVVNGASSSLYISARTAVATGAAGANGITAITMGAAFVPSTYLNGKIAEVAIYSGALTAAQINALLAYFGTRYAITIGA